ncbi:HD domain-containing protein [Enterococcus columbae]|uniref:HD protein n=1 Tax=Enterococcus columbae DSM 7374 = ATCC 51263 TaxID=1121865 RepID=S0KXY7_9ENTE|nr:HD domain-containing protein [Enterococcus columbae]EOT44943.1 HD protein [Enterococcus columbae DSM 7374 = ATCC 51263]EOW84236.1 HD protein [Enterococcus columbae DSM 7374 = ATCC 51263]OJG24987.1 HD protein [Enterococcus columbae DSM 7374 = ATCC 51263]
MPIPYKDQVLPREKVFRDPIHTYIHVQSRVIWDLINSSEFQRLRRIKQLGTASFTFHGAEHSRFSHSLGVYEIARQICDIFQKNYSVEQFGEDGWNDEERLVTLCAALLHDVGHGPYSHTFEHIFHTDHEALTVQIITSPKTEIYQILNRVAAGFPEKVASVIQKTYPNPQVVQIISSQIDADRMDYLLRDAYYTGTEYGTFDLTRILRDIRPHKKGIIFSISGMHAIEDYIISRYQMYMQIYFHPTSRGMEVVLEHLLNRASELYKNNQTIFSREVGLLLPFLAENFHLEDYLELDDGVLTTCFHYWRNHPDQILSDLAKRFLNRKPFKSIKFQADKQQAQIPMMQNYVEKAGFFAKYYTAIHSSFDLPYDLYRPDVRKPRTQIELQQLDGSLVELSTISPLVAALAGQGQGDDRFYFPKEMVDQSLQDNYDLFYETYNQFKRHIHNGALVE